MSESYKLKYTRWLKQGKSDLMSVTAMNAMTTLAYGRMVDAKWIKTDEQLSVLPPHWYDQTGFKDSYDAAKFCGDYVKGQQIAYACAACYSIKLPDDSRVDPWAKVEAVLAFIDGDRWLSGGAIVSAFLSSQDTPPEWATVTDTASPSLLLSSPDPVPDKDAVTTPDWKAPLREILRSNGGPDTRYGATITAVTATNADKYLHVVIRLADYIGVPQIAMAGGGVKDSAWIEGSAAIDGTTLAVQFDREVSMDDIQHSEDGMIDTDHDGWSDIAEHYAGTDRNDSRDVPATVLDLICDYPGHLSGGDIVLHAYSNAQMIGHPDAIYHVPLTDWVINGTARFIARLDTEHPVKGGLKEGPVWFFAFIDETSSGSYATTMPACVAKYGETDISWGHNTVHLAFSDTAFGYARAQWASTPTTGMLVQISYPVDDVPANDVVCFKKRIFGRNYIHEGDFLYLPETSEYYALRIGLPVYNYESVYTVSAGESTQTITHTWTEDAMQRLIPYVAPELMTATVTGRDVVVRWVGDVRSSSFAIRIDRDNEGAWQEILVRFVHAASPYSVSGLLGKYEIIVNYTDAGSRLDLSDGNYRVSVSNIVNQEDVAPVAIPYTVGGGGVKGSRTWTNSYTSSGNSPGRGKDTTFGDYIAPGGGGGGFVILGISGSVPIEGAMAGGNGANGGGGFGTFSCKYSSTSMAHIPGHAGGGLVVPPVAGGFQGGWSTATVSYPPGVGISDAFYAGGGGGGAGGVGGNVGASTTGGSGGKGYKVKIGDVDDYFGCGGGGGGNTGGNGRKNSDPDAKTGQGGSTNTVASGYTTDGLDGYGDGGGGGLESASTHSHGNGGCGVIYILEKAGGTSALKTLSNASTHKTTSYTASYTPAEGVTKIDVVLVGGGGAGGFVAQHPTAVSAWGQRYGGGGGGGGGVLALLDLSVRNTAITTAWTSPVEFVVDTTDNATNGPYSVSGTITDNLDDPIPLTLVLYRKPALIAVDGLVREGFGGLPAAVHTVSSSDGTYTIQGVTPGTYVLLARTSPEKVKLSDDYWHSYADGRPKPFEVGTMSLTGIDLTVE